MTKWDYLVETDEEERELVRRVRAGDERAKVKLKSHRIRSGKARRHYNIVLAHVAEGPWRDRWVRIGSMEPAIRDEVRTDYGYPTSNWEDPWLVGVGAGFGTLRYMVYARNASDAYTACQEEWPDMFMPDDEDDEPELRILSACSTWQLGRTLNYNEMKPIKFKFDTELLDGTLVERV
jgi:hypothetical protein